MVAVLLPLLLLLLVFLSLISLIYYPACSSSMMTRCEIRNLPSAAVGAVVLLYCAVPKSASVNLLVAAMERDWLTDRDACDYCHWQVGQVDCCWTKSAG